MPGFLQSLFPCFGGGDEQQQQDHQHPRHQHEQPPSKRQEGGPSTSSNTSAYATPIQVSEPPSAQSAPLYKPDTDKKLPPQPGAHSNVIELPGSSPDLYEMPASHIPSSHPLAARPSTATSADSRSRPSHQSDRQQPPLSPYSGHSAPSQTPGGSASVAGSTYQSSLRAPSERGDPDEISPCPTNASQDYPRGAKPNMYSNVADALTDRKRMFERLRQANGVEGQAQGQAQGQANGAEGYSGAGAASASQLSFRMGAVTPVEMEAPMQQSQQQQQAPSELAATAREHVRNPSGPKELE